MILTECTTKKSAAKRVRREDVMTMKMPVGPRIGSSSA